jgi:ribosomal protein S18 acetylase RimI-like enzyme
MTPAALPPNAESRAPFLVDQTRHAEVTRVLCDAFHDYPVMRYVVGSQGTAYDEHLKAMIGYFVQARFIHGDPVLAAADAGELVAVATLAAPGAPDEPPPILSLRERLWNELGEEAHRRYGSLCDIWDRFHVTEPHYHVHMIGVSRSHQGRGYARILLDHVHALSSRHPHSVGVSLTTEDPRNVPLYEHLGYRVLGRESLGKVLEVWGFLREDERHGPQPQG